MTINYTIADNDGVNVSCPSNQYTQSCMLRPAIIEYPVKIQNDTLQSMSLAVDPRYDTADNETFRYFNYTLMQENGFKILNISNIYENPQGGERTRLGGIAQGFQQYLGGDATMHYGDQGYHLEQSGNAATYLTNDLGVQTGGLANAANLCGFQFGDPMKPYDFGGWAASSTSHDYDVPALVGKINQIMFALALDISGEDDDKNVALGTLVRPAHVIQDAIFYKTNFAFMYGALASMLVCVICVLPVYYGYWQLGRPVTLGPFEIAAAFRAPDLHHPKNAPIETVIKDLGNRKVKFGEVMDGHDIGKIGVAEADKVASLPGAHSPRAAEFAEIGTATRVSFVSRMSSLREPRSPRSPVQKTSTWQEPKSPGAQSSITPVKE